MNKEKETILIIAAMALMGAIGCVSLIFALFGIDVARIGFGSFLGFVTGLSGIFFVLLMIGNYD